MSPGDGSGTSYYADRIDSLKEIFGRDDVALTASSVTCGEASYPVVDDVIILLAPHERPARLRRLEGRGGRSSVAAADIQETFGAEWTAYDEVLAEHEDEFARYFDLVDLDGLGGLRAADLGCGGGRWSSFLAPRCREIVLVDFSEAIFVARRNLRDAPNALFFMGDVRTLPFGDDFCDLLFSLGVLHHLPVPCLEVVRSFGRLAPRQLYFLYYAFDNRPVHYRLLLALVTAVRSVTSRITSPAFRKAFSVFALWACYMPLIALGRLLRPLGWSSHVPLYDFYHDRSPGRIEQDVYDRFFTRIEQRVKRREIESLGDTFGQVTVAEGLPYWHFLCERQAPGDGP